MYRVGNVRVSKCIEYKTLIDFGLADSIESEPFCWQKVSMLRNLLADSIKYPGCVGRLYRVGTFLLAKGVDVEKFVGGVY